MKHTLAYYLTNYSLCLFLVGLVALVMALACWIAIDCWRKEEEIRRIRREEHRRANQTPLRGHPAKRKETKS